METTSSFGYWIRRQRKALDLTQQTLADKVGCSLAAIKKIESDERRPSRQIAERMAAVLDVPASQCELFLEVARGIRSVDQLSLAHERAVLTPYEKPKSFPHNLPVQLTSFIGRERELSEVKKSLATTHLLMLTGPGGTGKTRLALQLASEVLEDFREGVWLVELASLTDATLVTQTIASILSLREQPGRTILDTLMDYVRAKRMLLILDNCEHLIETCAQLTNALLRATPLLKILATSRESLGIAGETIYRVPSLPLPTPQQLHDLDALAQNDCVHLFVDRATAAYPSFRLKKDNLEIIADICRRLDGIPLAIELAAARTKIFRVEEIATRLNDRFRLLTGGSRTALERHQTLFALIDWSYNLLSDAERVLLRRLAVFTGGCSFDAAEAVCGNGIEEEVLDLLTRLVDKSLVAVEEETEEARYHLPETIRQYARDKLFESGEAELVRDRHLGFFIRFAKIAEPNLRAIEQLTWLKRVESEHDNLRAALAWSLESSKSERMLELANALYYFWECRGYPREGCKWLDEALALAEHEQLGRGAALEIHPSNYNSVAQYAKALYADGRLHFTVSFNPNDGRARIQASLHIAREIGDTPQMVIALEHLGWMSILEGDIQLARIQLEEGVSLARKLEDRWPLALCLLRLASPLMRTDVVMARRIAEEGVALARSLGDYEMMSYGLTSLAATYFMEGNPTAAAPVVEEALAKARSIGGGYVTLSLFFLVVIKSLQGDSSSANGYCFQLLTRARETGYEFAVWNSLLALGWLESFGGRPDLGTRLLTAAEVGYRLGGVKLENYGGPIFMVYKQALERAQMQLDTTAFEAAVAEGRQMTPEEAFALLTEHEVRLTRSQSMVTEK